MTKNGSSNLITYGEVFIETSIKAVESNRPSDGENLEKRSKGTLRLS